MDFKTTEKIRVGRNYLCNQITAIITFAIQFGLPCKHPILQQSASEACITLATKGQTVMPTVEAPTVNQIFR